MKEPKKIAVQVVLTKDELAALKGKSLSDINSQAVLIAVRTYIADVAERPRSVT